ncbi:MAG: DUF1491 family protein [Candidatus Phaeomarinobacter sp.]
MQPRLKSELRVQAILRRATTTGAFASIARRGHAAAGAVFVKSVSADRDVRVFGPAPGPGTDEAGQPRWTCVSGTDPILDADAEAYLARYAKADPDFWVIEIEAGNGEACLDGVIVEDVPIQTDPLIDQVFRR